MLPGKAIRLPRPSRLRSRLATKATATPYQGPSSTAHSTLTMCCTGAHLLPNTGNENMLPTTATAHSTPARASFLVLDFILELLFPLYHNEKKRKDCRQKYASRPHGHNKPLTKRAYRSVEACWLPLTPEHGFPSLTLLTAQGAPPRPAFLERSDPSFPKSKNKSRVPMGSPAKKTFGKVLPTVA